MIILGSVGPDVDDRRTRARARTRGLATSTPTPVSPPGAAPRAPTSRPTTCSRYSASSGWTPPIFRTPTACRNSRRRSRGLTARYRPPPWVVPLLLDDSGQILIDRDRGNAEGRFAFLDLAIEGRWGGVITGDRVTADFSTPNFSIALTASPATARPRVATTGSLAPAPSIPTYGGSWNDRRHDWPSHTLSADRCEHRSDGSEITDYGGFTTPRLDLDELVWPRSAPGSGVRAAARRDHRLPHRTGPAPRSRHQSPSAGRR